MSKSRDNNGKFKKTGNWKTDMAIRSDAARDMHGFGKHEDFKDEVLKVTEKAMTSQGTARAKSAYRSISEALQTDFAEIYSPSQNFFSEDASGGDDFAEGGRVPQNELVSMTTFRVGWGWKATFGKAQMIYRNGYEFVPEDFTMDTKPTPQKEIKKFFDEVDWFSWRIQHLYRAKQTGLGIGIPIFPGEKTEDLGKKININTIKARPLHLKAYSSYHLSPSNMLEYEFGDYDKSKWDFRGGINATTYNHTRTTLLEPHPEPFHLRGIAEIEPCWTPAICYYNLMIFVLKAFANMGTMSMGIKSPNEIPTVKEAQSYLEMLDLFRANKFYVLGQGAELVTENMITKIGGGISEIYEVLKEDISACVIIPKNQLFGRAEGGGLDGAGALVSKDDMLAGLMAEAQDMTSEELSFLRGPCKFEKHLEGLTLRWRLDLHKTEMERLQEEAMRIDMDMKRDMAKQAKQQLKMNGMLMNEQMKQIKSDPKGYLEKMNTEVEQKTEGSIKDKPEGKALVDKRKQPNSKIKKERKADMVDFMQYYRDVKFNYGGPLDKKFTPRKVDEDL